MQTNFGGNLCLRPQAVHVPRDEGELLDLLRTCRGRKLRAIGRLHSWSEAPTCDDVLVDCRHLNQVLIEDRPDGVVATVGGGCQIKRLLAELARQAGATLPTLGLITEQTIAGAVSTGTHGSGRHCLSQYVSAVRLATFDQETGEPTIIRVSGGSELEAAKCAVGCMGIIVSVELICRSEYRIEEHVRGYDDLNEVLAAETEFPLQQFFYLPWKWKFLAQHRRETVAERSWLASVYRLYWLVTIDVMLHLVIKLLVQALDSRRLVRFFYRRVLSLFVIRNWRVIDRSDKMLIMEHELFRHIEIELFVRRSALPDALTHLRETLECFDGDLTAVSPASRERLERINMLQELFDAAGSYTHHYAICIRRVEPDTTLISMASGGDEDYYAISLISYARPHRRQGFLEFAGFLARSMARLFSARPHWGKVCPLTNEELAPLYPNLPEFRRVCEYFDSTGRFRNQWVERALWPAAAEPVE